MLIVKLLIGILIVWGLAIGLLFLFQEQILYTRKRASKTHLKRIEALGPRVESIEILTDDQTKLHGWLVKNSPLPKAPLVIYFGGQGDELSAVVEEAANMEGWSFLLINYRGYGFSQGRPSEKKILGDSLRIYDSIASREDIDQEWIVLMGRSLGTGVATFLARRRWAKGVILVSPYDSILSVAKGKFPFIPVEKILRDRYEAILSAPHIETPLLAIIAERDRMVTPSHSMRLIEEWRGPKQLATIKGKGHNDLFDSADYWESIQQFLAGIR
ncbi:hypothetical protein EDC14_102342 [Hydrogenispora ethanolica]|uniref:Serine aminopeptidase S33 domain-containing protein n=1 Tax=Hydrogenispora ethanolica TaxID=1082276 RepID=A0A4R1RAH8_HYDET|nr:hypothetical protein [Hydrogenispora ethanolica]TCL62763.1 hypothetical protein EDC14_102342 [Hydrogenispora ethanolica]